MSQTVAAPAGVEVSRASRLTSYDVADFPVPTGREEDWRFTPLDRLRGLPEWDPAVPAPGVVSVEVEAPAPVRLEAVGVSDPRRGRAGQPGDRVGALAFAGAPHTHVISVPPGVSLAEPVSVRVSGTGLDPAFSHLLIDVGAQAEGVVIIDHTGSATLADNLEVLVGDGAKVTLVLVDDWADDAVHLSDQRIRVGRDARLRVITATLGGDLVRLTPAVRFAGPGGDVEMLGLYFADAGQHFEHRLFVDHAQPHCRSRVTYKGAVQGQDAHTVWVGDVLIRANAAGTDTYEANRNLILTDGARADAVPNLEIETGEIIGAGHAATTGRFDDEQLFYLCSRGVPEAQARQLVVRGFFSELIRQVEVPQLAARLETAIESELARTVL